MVTIADVDHLFDLNAQLAGGGQEHIGMRFGMTGFVGKGKALEIFLDAVTVQQLAQSVRRRDDGIRDNAKARPQPAAYRSPPRKDGSSIRIRG